MTELDAIARLAKTLQAVADLPRDAEPTILAGRIRLFPGMQTRPPLKLAEAAVRKAKGALRAAEKARATTAKRKVLEAAIRKAKGALRVAQKAYALPDERKRLQAAVTNAENALKAAEKANALPDERKRLEAAVSNAENGVRAAKNDLAHLSAMPVTGPTETLGRPRVDFPVGPQGPLPWHERREWHEAGKGGRWNAKLPAAVAEEDFVKLNLGAYGRIQLRLSASTLPKHKHINKDLIVRVAQRLLGEGVPLRELATKIANNSAEIQQARDELGVDGDTYDRSTIDDVLVELGIRQRRKAR